MATRDTFIGRRLLCKITGFSGICTSFREELGGTVAAGIQPACSADKTDVLPDAISLDIQTIDVIGDGVAALAKPEPDVTVKLGDKVRDTITGTEGIALARVSFINGCVFFTVQGVVGQDGKVPDQRFTPWNQLEVIPAPPPKVKRTETGGPSIRMPAARAPR
jgi:hypothetical protein